MSQKNKMLLVLVAVAVLAAVAVAIVVTRNGKNENRTPATGQNQKTQTNSALLGESFNDDQAGVSMQLPKGWTLAPKNEKNPASLTRFVWSGGGASGGQANGELSARTVNVPMDDIVRGYLEAAMDINVTPKLLDNQDERIGDRVVRVLSQEMPGPGGVNGRITQYIIYSKGTYYILSYTMLSSDFESQRPAIEESVKSLKIPQ